MSIPRGFDFDADLHLFQHKGINILLDVNSGAVSILDDLGHHFIQKLKECDGDSRQTLERLADDYIPEELSSLLAEMDDTYEAGAIFTPEEPLAVDWSELPIKALCLNVAHACNMKCRYCFASQGDFGMKPQLMSFSTGRQALDFLIARSGAAKNLEVDFFGGEPLLNWAVIKQLVQYGRQMEPLTGKRFNFTLTTNAVLLDEEIMDFIIGNNIGVILSLDGRCSTNDQHRIMSDGGGSYDIILPKIKQMVARKPISYFIRGTFTNRNLDFSSDLQHIIELGFDAVSLEPAVGPTNPYAIQDSDLPAVLAEYDRLTDLLYSFHCEGRNISFFHYNLDLQKGPCLAKRLSGCGAGVEYLVITPEGDIYPCHQFVGESQFVMGNIDGAELDEAIIAKFAGNRLADKETCRKCWARNYCGGGCHANAYHANGDMSVPDPVSCAMHRKRIEGAIYLEVIKNLDKSIRYRKKQESCQ
ncbi:MAG: thioether cross-link-forming SCIFF peptide maturase [Syntrophomonadaceae bacterium]